MKIRMAAGLSRSSNDFIHCAIKDKGWPNEKEALKHIASFTWEPFIVEMEVPDPVVWDEVKVIQGKVICP